MLVKHCLPRLPVARVGIIGTLPETSRQLPMKVASYYAIITE